jgi:GT2 family glycosyltransferase
MLTIILPSYNNPGFTELAAKTALLSTSQLRLRTRFIFIDDAGAHGEPTFEVFRKVSAENRAPNTTIVRTKANVGYTGSFSLGLHLSRTELTLFLSNDMLLTPAYLQALLGVAALSPEFGCVRGTSRSTDGLPEHSVVPPDTVRTYEDVQAFADGVLRANGLDHVEDPLLCGDAVLIKRAVIEAIGVHDMALTPYFSDIDYGMRAQIAGFKLVAAKGAWLHHEAGGYTKRDAQRFQVPMETAYGKRMRQVRQCWDVFRAKWGSELAEWTDASSQPHFKQTTDYRAIALRNRHRVPLRVDPPATLLEQIEFV